MRKSLGVDFALTVFAEAFVSTGGSAFGFAPLVRFSASCLHLTYGDRFLHVVRLMNLSHFPPHPRCCPPAVGCPLSVLLFFAVGCALLAVLAPVLLLLLTTGCLAVVPSLIPPASLWLFAIASGTFNTTTLHDCCFGVDALVPRTSNSSQQCFPLTMKTGFSVAPLLLHVVSLFTGCVHPTKVFITASDSGTTTTCQMSVSLPPQTA